MAEKGSIDEEISKTFMHFVQTSSVGKTLTDAQKKEMTDKGMNKMISECCGAVAAKASDSQVFYGVALKTKKVTLAQFHSKYMPDLAAVLVHNERTKKDRAAKRPDQTDAEVVSKLAKIKEQIAAKSGAKTKVAAVDATTQRLTDTKGYTGSHKERFDESGKGKGLEGRETKADDSGYVGGYTNKDTFGKK